MRDLFGIRLTDPTAEEFAPALRAAVGAVNGRQKVGTLPALTDQNVSRFCERVVKEREGVDIHTGVPVRGEVGKLVVAWWTNPAGRKLVRVRGWRERGPGVPGTWEANRYLVEQRDFESRPAVWHLDPERIVAADTGGEPDWIAVCGCGAAGSPETLGWSHGMCGPCADRVAEFGLDSVPREPGVLAETGFQPWDVTFTPDGRFVIASGFRKCRVWDSATGELRALGDTPRPSRDLHPSVSPDGRFAFLSDGDSSITLLAFDPVPRREVIPSIGLLSAALWTGRKDELLLQSFDGERRVMTMNASDGHTRRSVPPPDVAARLFAVHPNPESPLVVFAERHYGSVARVERDGTLAVESRFHIGDGKLNRTGNWNAGPEIVLFTPDGERLLFIRGTELELRHVAKPKALLQATFSAPIRDAVFAPDYEHLYVLSTDGVIHVCHPGVLTSVRARLRWHVGPASRLAVSRDGQLLATAGVEGVKLWPVGRLLPLLD